MGLWSDLRATARALRRDWRFCLVAIACLSVGITAATTTFGIIDTLYVRPPIGIRDPQTLVQVAPSFPHLGRAMPGGVVSYPTFTSLRRAAARTVNIAAFGSGRATIDDAEHARAVATTLVSANYFSVLGARPALGRFFAEQEEQPTRSSVVVLDHDFWERQFGSDATVVGRSVRLGQLSYIVIGVAERNFAGVDGVHSDIWLTLGAARDHAMVAEPLESSAFWLKEVARLAPDVTLERAGEVVTFAAKQVALEHGAAPTDAGLSSVRLEKLRPPLLANWGASVRTLSTAASLSAVLSGAALFALMMASANAALLFLLRGLGRHTEVATRLAIGASRFRVIRLLALEPIVLGLTAMAVALSLTQIALRLVSVIPGANGVEVAMDWRLLLFAVVVSFSAALAASLGPAIATRDLRIAESLRGATATMGRTRSRLRHGLLFVQVVCAFVLLSTSVLLLRTSAFLRGVDVGMAVDEVVVVTGRLETHLGERTRPQRAIETVSQELMGRGYIRSMTRAEFLPFRSALSGLAAHDLGGQPISVRFDPVDTGYFRTLGIPLLQGREFLSDEVRSATQVTVVNQTLARAWWGSRQAIGQCVYRGDRSRACWRVVGVVGDVMTGNLREPAQPILYLPIGTDPLFTNLVVRTWGPASAVIGDLQSALSRTSAEVSEIIPLRQLTSRQAEAAGRRAWPFLVCGLCAIFIAVVGVIALVSFVTRQRATEFAIRRALGASDANLARVALGELAGIVLLAIVLGALLASTAGALFGDLLFGLTVADPMSHVMSAFIIIALCICASIPPLWRLRQLPLTPRLRAD